MAGERGGAASADVTFAQTLGELKREGCNILLVGTDTVDAHAAVCHRLLGETGSESRYRLLVTGDDDRERLDHADDVPIETIDYAELEFASGSESVGISGRTPLGTLGIEIIETVDEIDEDADGLEPAELRVCVDSLVPLLEEHTVEKVFRLLHMTTSRVGHVHGMGHYHLPLDRDHDAVNLFEPMFDAIVEVRVRDGEYEHRWELRDRDTTTEWLCF